MNYIYISKPLPDRGIYGVINNENGVLYCDKLNTGEKGVVSFFFNDDQAQPVTFHNFLSERFKLLEDKKMKVNLTVEELCNFVEEWEEFKRA